MLKIMIGFLIPVVVAVILSVSFKMFKNEVTHYWQMISALAALLALIFTSINLLTSILIGGIIGFLWGEKKVLNIQDHLEIKSIQYLGVGVGICLSFLIFLFFFTAICTAIFIGRIFKSKPYPIWGWLCDDSSDS